MITITALSIYLIGLWSLFSLYWECIDCLRANPYVGAKRFNPSWSEITRGTDTRLRVDIRRSFIDDTQPTTTAWERREGCGYGGTQVKERGIYIIYIYIYIYIYNIYICIYIYIYIDR